MNNGSVGLAEEAAAGVVGYEPETPFMLDGYGRAGASSESATSSASPYERESPFISEYMGEDEAPFNPQAEAFAGLIGELHDEEFNEAVTDLVHEASALAETEFSQEIEPARRRSSVEQGLRGHFAPLIRESEATVDRLAQGIGSTDLTTMSEAELETFLDRFAPGDGEMSPVFNQFLGSFFKKAKKAVSGAVAIAKKGIALASKLNPINLALGRIRTLARPLVERVLKYAINRLPVAVRPVAQQLAKKFLGISLPAQAAAAHQSSTEPAPTPDEPTSDAPAGEPAAADPAEIAEEFDVRLAGGMLGGDAFARHEAVDAYEDSEAVSENALYELEDARARFAQAVARLQPGENPGPVVEQFLPAILGALKLGVRIVGRPRVVKFLAGLVANLIRKYVGKAQAVTLSQALVDAGLRLVNLEITADESDEAGHAIAATVEETVTRVVRDAPESAWESEAVLDGYVREALASAASAHFPDSMIRPELHEAAGTSGAWVAMPQGRRPKHYKKYTRVMDVTITPQVAAAVKTFGGASLQSILADRMGAAANQPVTARVHLYEALPGSTLSDIASHEKGVAGLGSVRPEASSRLHPLTPNAAGMLFREPGLGRPANARFLNHRNLIAVGQRFYHIEPTGAAGHTHRSGHRRTRTRIALDFPKGEIRVLLYFREAAAQDLAAKLRARAPLSVLLAALKEGIESRLSTILSGAPTRAVRVIHEAVPTEQLLAPVLGPVLRSVGPHLRQALVRWLIEAVKRELEQRYDAFAGALGGAANADADGLTLVVTFQRPPMLERLRKLFAGGLPSTIAQQASTHSSGSMANYSLSVRPGYVTW